MGHPQKSLDLNQVFVGLVLVKYITNYSNVQVDSYQASSKRKTNGRYDMSVRYVFRKFTENIKKPLKEKVLEST